MEEKGDLYAINLQIVLKNGAGIKKECCLHRGHNTLHTDFFRVSLPGVHVPLY